MTKCFVLGSSSFGIEEKRPLLISKGRHKPRVLVLKEMFTDHEQIQ